MDCAVFSTWVCFLSTYHTFDAIAVSVVICIHVDIILTCTLIMHHCFMQVIANIAHAVESFLLECASSVTFE